MKSRLTTLLTVLTLAGGTGGAIAVAANSGAGSGNSSAQAQYNGNGKKCGIPGAADPSCPPTANGKKGSSAQHTTSTATTVSDVQSNLGIDRSQVASFQGSSTPNWANLHQTLANVVQDIGASHALGDSADEAALTALAQRALVTLSQLDAGTLNRILDGASATTPAALNQVVSDYRAAVAAQDYHTAAELALGQLFLQNALGHIRLAPDQLASTARSIVISASRSDSAIARELRAMRVVAAKALARAIATGNAYAVDELSLQGKVLGALLAPKSTANTQTLEQRVARKMQLATQHRNTLAYNKLRLEKALLLAKIRHDS